ncbi:phosphatase PAP2 family protein [[Clostridium] aminophilum]|uniref:PAP2 superfamily protein n=1 Tax=[Clostridium] aminophilum TaxID=1526 RepID=A0A1I0DBX5_9FIRM|nr:phosphatase PAP2 family protein [[Clostridium] aminophilum]SET29737.1 PAP2 superfamily protein [[Clostridium] aminophilum]SFR82732.1 PAP2 superfamily protein [[Clostridium] aminophilum]
MDINILLGFQEFRNGVGSCLTAFMTKMSYIGEMNTVLIFTALIYWCVSKNFGTYLLMGWSGNRIVNGLLKVSACVYRPWIRDPRIIPDSDALASATGYSFPSGHSMNAASLFGGGAIRRELPRLLRVVLGLIAVLIALSRNFLGVHTPQDILVGLAAGVLVMWLTAKLLAWINRHPEKDIAVMCAGIGISVAVAAYAALKSYPVDYDAAGKLLVDGAKMANDTFKGVGWCIGFLLGWVLERRYVGFSTDIPMMTRMTRLTAGLLGYYAVSLILLPLFKSGIPGAGGTLLTCFVQMFYVTFLVPFCIKHLEHKPAA